ncbi:hypothetical protein D3841_00730 [Streptococcus mutans]|uniref:Uncharacterized protein n=1 Tax=Streptococcus mutans serotype c (strain ATCC 700610 / UA159) TaxID=210007 RepID=Q8DV02_STRMU|nr:hypothetical protein SMU_722 [Streptococcus mutans UA159]AJD55103.1 hypothetical protein SMUFR_0630 [Streptococcus mutans UA159-FR]NLQ45165.1 hypothetical protein [Streptococcus mutans]NLQ71770.1 hypothetical protein [Streptococcus mutans]NLQ77457.1 hypothetical protein [Streptococcus mutans]
MSGFTMTLSYCFSVESFYKNAIYNPISGKILKSQASLFERGTGFFKMRYFILKRPLFMV